MADSSDSDFQPDDEGGARAMVVIDDSEGNEESEEESEEEDGSEDEDFVPTKRKASTPKSKGARKGKGNGKGKRKQGGKATGETKGGSAFGGKRARVKLGTGGSDVGAGFSGAGGFGGSIRRRRPKGWAGTLVIAPMALITHWRDELTKHTPVGPLSLSVLVYHGQDRRLGSSDLANFDVVVTSYGVVTNESPPLDTGSSSSTAAAASSSGRTSNSGEGSSSGIGSMFGGSERGGPLFSVKWSRIVIDEAHTIKNPTTSTARAVVRA